MSRPLCFITSANSAAISHSTVLKFGDWLVAALREYYRRNRMLDEATDCAFSHLMRSSMEAGQYLSPKDVPFDVDGFAGLLAISRT
jgi:hypothetical protein